MNSSDLAAARRWFAEEPRHVAHVRSPLIVHTFANVPRERFAGAGSRRLISPMAHFGYLTSDDDDPSHLYHENHAPRPR